MPKKTIDIFNRTELQPGDVILEAPVSIYVSIKVEREVPIEPFVPDPEVWRPIKKDSDEDRNRHTIAVKDDPAHQRWTYYVRKDED